MRTQRSVNGKKYRYIVDGTRILRDEYQGVDYLYDSEGKVCGMVYKEKTYYFAKNLQGDVISITTDGGREIARYSYDAWGKCTITAAGTWQEVAEANVYRYRSYVYDSDLGLYYLHNRYYDPEVGRFISEDPARDGTNWYAYCGSDAVNYVDPDGLWRRVDLGYEAQSGDTLWGLSVQLFGNGAHWRDLGYPYDLGSRPLQVGDVIGYQGGLIEYDANGVPYANVSMVIYENNAYHEPETMPEPPKRPDPAPSKPTASGGVPNNSGSVSSTNKPGNVNASGMSSGGMKPGGGKTGGSGGGRYKSPSADEPVEAFVSNWTLYYFYGEDQKSHAQRNIKILQKKYTVYQGLITSTREFLTVWNDALPENVDTVIINFHGNPNSVHFINLYKMKPKQINTLILLSCNAGHLHTGTETVAQRIYNHSTIKQFVACDGTHVRGTFWHPFTGIRVIDDEEWRSAYGESITPEVESWGFVLYTYDGNMYSLGYTFSSVAKLLEYIGKW